MKVCQSELTPLNQLYCSRLNRVRQAMIETDTPVLLILDSVNILYATGASNMTLFSTRVPARYLLLFAEGPVILFDYFGCEHLTKELPTINQVLPARGLCFTSSGGAIAQNAVSFAEDIAEQVDEYLGNEKRLAIDRFPYSAVDALRNRGFKVKDADSVMYRARKTKMPMEIDYMKEAIRRVEAAVSHFQEAIEPGKSETEVWAEFHKRLIADYGQYVATRLMQSGERTFPYFQECSSRRMQKGDLVCLDTDALGYQGYAVDFSRTYICGDVKPTREQKKLFTLAKDQLDWNMSLFSPGTSFEEIARKAWVVPEEHSDSRYYCIGHGLGMSGEHPNIPHFRKGESYSLKGELEKDMVICIESYIGSKKIGQGVKLEEQILITESGFERMSQSSYEEKLLL